MSGDPRRRKLPAIVMPTPPDLQALVHQYGGYYRIPNDAWAKYHDQLISVWVWLSQRHFPKHTARKRTKRKINSTTNDANDPLYVMLDQVRGDGSYLRKHAFVVDMLSG